MALTDIVKARKCGQIRFHAVYQYPVDLNCILEKCQLKPEADRLLDVKRDEAVRVLTCWLHREPAYDTVVMSLESARELSEKFVPDFADETSRFFTNGRWDVSQPLQSWNRLTDSVFDGGLLIESGTGNDTRH